MSESNHQPTNEDTDFNGFKTWHEHDFRTTHREFCWPVGIVSAIARVCIGCGVVKDQVYKLLKQRPNSNGGENPPLPPAA